MHRFFRKKVIGLIFMASLAVARMAHAHVVPNMTVEATFDSTGGYTLHITLDPRTFLSADPTSLPPVPAAWYLDQTPAQTAATHEKAQQYLVSSLGLLFDGKKAALPACKIQAVDGADNTPLKADTQEVHLLGTVSGQRPEKAASFQIDFGKNANTSLILLQSQAGMSEIRPRVVFPGETSPPFHLKAAAPAAALPAKASPASSHQMFLILSISMTCIVVIVGWVLLSHYRHHHRFHRRPGADKM